MPREPKATHDGLNVVAENSPAVDPLETIPPPANAAMVGRKIVRKDTPPLDRTNANVQDTLATLPPDIAEAPMAEKQKPALAADSAAEKSATKLGDYKLLKKLGQGGMGAVYKAHQISQNRIVALKVLAKELANKESFVLRFKREARAMAKLDHPNVLACLDVGEAKGFHFLAMELVEGGSVEGWLKKLGRFQLGDALHIIVKTCEALQHAHEKSIIHRDIKPDNILLTADGVIKVADLGLAKDTDEDVSLTKTGAGAGTPIYMAPEQARDVKRVDVRVDVYAVGVMMYVLLTGQPPFQGNTLVELISAKEKGKFEPMRKHNDEVPAKLDLIVDKMISKDPKLRYASCQEVLDELEPLGLTADHLSFFAPETGAGMPALGSDEMPEEENEPTQINTKAAKTKGPGKVAPKTTGPGKMVAKTSGPQKNMAGKTTGPQKNLGAKTTAPTQGGGLTRIEEEEEVDRDAWYWNMVTPEGKIVNKKLSTEQVRALIKAGHMDQKAELSKTKNGPFRAAATFMEFQGAFKSREATTKANIKGQSYRDKYKEIERDYDRQQRYGWIGRMFKGAFGRVFGLLWILIILGVVGAAGYLGYKHFISP